MNNSCDDLEARIAKLEKNGVPGLRDFFASSALTIGLGSACKHPTDVTRYAYQVADEMIKHREKYASN